MIKLLMVDDEPLVLVGLQSMLNWDEHGIEICGTARNGEIAMEIIEHRRPDVVITDIKMPVLGGLDLMAKCREKFGRIPLFIILTSAEEYNHIKQAMSNQAVDYLIKLELDAEMLTQSILKAKDILHSLGIKKDEAVRHGTQSLYDRFFIGLLTEQFKDEEHIKSQSNELLIDFCHDAYVVCYCDLETLCGTNTDTERLINLYASCVTMIRETTAQYMPCHVTSVDLRHFAIIFCLNKHDSEAYQNILCNILRQTIRLIHNYFNVNLRCGIGTVVATPSDISASYSAACKTHNNLKHGESIYFYQDIKKSPLVEQMKEYITKNLDKRLTLAQVSEVFGYTPKYVSALFAKHASRSFIDYVNAEKIARAKEMLLQNDAKIYEISDLLGFESAFYFSKVFKKHTSMSPREYLRKNM